ncbi:MAG: hypothetical protein PHV97_01465 [Candidatus Omnitrophica bacterium]|nr:hypothetical protein [Candidatus Omnitrophota bacterium]
MSDTLSPEERLFKVIQQGKLTPGQDSGANKKKTGGWFEIFKRFTPAKNAAKPGAGWKAVLPVQIRWPELEPDIINKVLVAVLVVLMVAAFWVSGKRKDVAVITEAVSKIRGSVEEGKKKIESLKALSFYLDEIRKRDIFRPSVETSAGEVAQRKSETIVKAAEKMKLQGISRGDVPKAMILCQDGNDSKMYFLVEGQAIGTTGFKVTKISKNTVTVGDGTEETVLL